MSAGQLFDLIMPAAFALSALLSTWVLASARKRFQLLLALGLAIGTLFLPVIVFPIYLAIMLWRKKIGPPAKWRYALPILYATIALLSIGIFFYLDSRSADAHLARATQAKLVEDSQTAIREYRQALASTTIHTYTNSSQLNLRTRATLMTRFQNFGLRSKEERLVNVRILAARRLKQNCHM
jgi:hypothetical protein